MDSNTLTTLIMLGVLIVGFYFMAIRPQQKKAKEQSSMQSALKPGDRVMTVHGILGTIKHIGQEQVIIEIAPGSEMTLLLRAISHTLTPEQDEFEYASDDDEDAVEEAVSSTDSEASA